MLEMSNGSWVRNSMMICLGLSAQMMGNSWFGSRSIGTDGEEILQPVFRAR